MERQDRRPSSPRKDGKPLDKNPFKDARVRKALSMAINRDAIVERVMEKKAVPAGQLLPDFFFGTSKKLKPPKYDPEGREEAARRGRLSRTASP